MRRDEVAGVTDDLDVVDQVEDAADLRAHRATMAADDGRRVPVDVVRAQA